jgi:lipoprotein-anchoring transpeptidase ErfK/SrfK
MIATLRQLTKIYLTAATAFVVMIVFSHHPNWAHATRDAGIVAKNFTVRAAVATNDNVLKPGAAYAQAKGGDLLKWAGDQIFPPVHVAKKEAPKHMPTQLAKQQPASKPQVAKKETAPVVIAKNEPAPSIDEQRAAPDEAPPLHPAIADDNPDVIASTKPQLAPDQTPQFPAMASRAGPGPGELVRVAQRLKSSLTEDLLNNFSLFLYVSKANNGPWSQRMYVFAKEQGGDLDMLYNWPVSTGREKWEIDVNGHKQNSFTPQGYYELDPNRMHAKYHSSQWNQPMPYAMFFNWEQNGYQTGLAIHGASGEDIAMLGNRASAGCVRLAPENARLLFNLIRSQYKGLAPKFAYDRRTATMSNNGILVHDKNGKIAFDNGYKVLVFVENYGGDNVVAALY